MKRGLNGFLLNKILKPNTFIYYRFPVMGNNPY